MSSMDLRSTWRAVLLVLLICGAMAVAPIRLGAQDAGTSEAGEPVPVTTGDPNIPPDHLKLLVKALTKEELVVESDAWRDLLKAKVQQIAHKQISVKEQKELAEQVQEKAESASPVATEPSASAPSDSAPSVDGGEQAEQLEDQRQELAEDLPQLREEQALLVDRLNEVVDALEAKGGDVESYRQYISAVSGLEIDVTDTATTWTVIKGWLASEQGGQRWMWNIAKFLMILVCFYFAASIVANVARHGAQRVKGASQLLVNFVGKFIKQVVMVIGLVVALAALEVNIGPLLAAIGAAGFVVAFALQDTLSNLASGLLILAYQPFDVGDVIEAAGVTGIVDSVSLFSTHIRTFDNKVMIVPNNDIWGSTITNATATDTRRVDLTFGISYTDDIEKAKNILQSLVEDHELVLEDPAPVIQLHELADSSVNFICRPWTKTADYWTVYWDITRAVKEEFDRAGISIPFPQRDIHVYHETVAGNGSSLERSAT